MSQNDYCSAALRAALVRDVERTGGYLRWVDMPPGACVHHYEQNNVQRHFTSGFVAKYGPLFEYEWMNNYVSVLPTVIFSLPI